MSPNKTAGSVRLSLKAAWFEFWRQLCDLRPECVRELETLAPEFGRCYSDTPGFLLPWDAFRELAADWAARWNLSHHEPLVRAMHHLDAFCTDHAAELPDCKRYRNRIKHSTFQLGIYAAMGQMEYVPLCDRTTADWDRRRRSAREAGVVPVFEFWDVWDLHCGETKTAARKRMKERFDAAVTEYIAAVEREDAAHPVKLWTGQPEYVGWLVRRIVPREAGGRGETDRDIRGEGGAGHCNRKTGLLAAFLGASELLPLPA